MHESRHLHALKRTRGKFGRFESSLSQSDDSLLNTAVTTSMSSYTMQENNNPPPQPTHNYPILPNPGVSGSVPATSNSVYNNMSALDEFRRLFGSGVNNKDIEDALKGMVQSGLVDLQHCTGSDDMVGCSTVGNSEQ